MTFFFCLQCYNLNESFIRRREYLFQTIYIDILFAINFSMDFLAIYITSYLLKLKFKTFKAVIAAILGALYSAFTVILRTDSIILALFFAYFMCYIAFEKRNLKNSIYNFIAYIAVNFLIGGGMTAVFSVFNKLVGERIVTIYGDVNSVPEKLPFSIFAVGVTFITALIIAFAKMFSKKGTAKNVKAEIFVGDKKGDFYLTEDSGNMLTEHLSGEPVIFLSEKAMLKITDEKTLIGVKNLDADIMKNSKIKMRVTVYETVSGKEMCVCMKPNKTLINGTNVRAWVAVGKGNIFGENDGIVPSILIKN